MISFVLENTFTFILNKFGKHRQKSSDYVSCWAAVDLLSNKTDVIKKLFFSPFAARSLLFFTPFLLASTVNFFRLPV